MQIMSFLGRIREAVSRTTSNGMMMTTMLSTPFIFSWKDSDNNSWNKRSNY